MSARTRPPSVGLRRIFHPTDFSQASEVAFAHALKLAILCRGALTIWHLDAPHTEYLHWSQYPRVRRTLQRWGILTPEGTPDDVRDLGIKLQKIQAMGRDVVREILDEIEQRPAELIVLATRQRSGLDRMLHRAIAKPTARHSRTPTLFVPEGSRGFVDWGSGELRLNRILVPIDSEPEPQPAIDYVAGLSKLVGCNDLAATIVHVGSDTVPSVDLPKNDGVQWEKLAVQGDVVDCLRELTAARSIDLIVLTTAGHHGFLDAVRGSTSERILDAADVPVLALPAVALQASGLHRVVGAPP